MRTWIAWVMNGNSFILLWLFDQVNPQLSSFPHLVPCLLTAACSCPLSPTSTQHRHLAPSCPLPWMHSPCWTHLWNIFDVTLNMEIKEKTKSSAGCVVWIFMRKTARKLNRGCEGASQWGWQGMAADKGSFSSTSLVPAASQRVGAVWVTELQHPCLGNTKKTKSQLFLCFLFIPPFSSWSIPATKIIIKKSWMPFSCSRLLGLKNQCLCSTGL